MSFNYITNKWILIYFILAVIQAHNKENNKS